MVGKVGTLDIVEEVDIRSVLPEVTDSTVVVRAPELKNSSKSYWHMGTSRLTRVKIDALCPCVTINTKNATKISGTSAEFWEPVQTLGTAVINVFHCSPIEVHVTPSNSAPFTADGIIGEDYVTWVGINNWYCNWCGRKCQVCLAGAHSVSPPRRRKFISDCIAIVRDHLRENSIPILTGAWASSSRQFDVLRLYLPPEVAQNDQLPISSVLDDYSDCLHVPGEKLPANTILSYPIELGEIKSIYAAPIPDYDEKYWDEIEIDISDFLNRGIIKRSSSPFNFVVSLNAKTDDSRRRIIVDFSWLNKHLEVEPVPIRRIIDVIDELYGQKYFSVFDLASASYQIELKAEDRHKTAFETRSGKYEFLRMPPTIKCASSYIQNLMNIILKGMEGKARACHDDIIVYAPTIEEHEIRLRQVLARIRDAGLSLQPTKCQLFSQRVKYLGHIVTGEGWFPDLDKIQKLTTTPLPTNAKDLQSYLGLVTAIKRFIPNYTDITQPMFNMLKPDNFCWTGKALACFRSFQSSLSTRLPLRYPNWDKKFHVMTRVSENGFQAVLKQRALENRAKMHPIAYASRKFEDNEIHLDADTQKVLAETWGRKKFSRYLRDEN